MCRLRERGCQSRWRTRKLPRLRSTSASFNTIPEDEWAASVQYQGTSSRSQVNASVKGTIWILTRACSLVMGGMGGMGVGGVGGGVPGEKLCWHMCKLCKERTNKHAGIWSMGPPAKSVLPLNPFDWDTVNESAQSGQEQQKHADWCRANLYLCGLVLWQTRIKHREKGTTEDTWKSR